MMSPRQAARRLTLRGAHAGTQYTAVGQGGAFTRDDFIAAYKAPGHAVFPPTTLVVIDIEVPSLWLTDRAFFEWR
jgi:hypothetical protein